MKASTHRSRVGVDIAVVERDCATVDADATSILPNNRSTSVKASTPSRGDGGSVEESSEGKHILHRHPASTQGSHAQNVSKSKHPNGAMGWFHEGGFTSAYPGLVGVDIAVVDCNCAAADGNASSVLPNNGRTSVKSEHPIEAMG